MLAAVLLPLVCVSGLFGRIRRNVKKATLLFLLCIALGATYASASIVGTTDSSLFQDHVDWCLQFNNCANTPFVEPSPSAFTSAGGISGFVGNVGTQQPFEVRQQGVSWTGNFPANMGVVYNGVSTINNDPADIAATFGVGVFGAEPTFRPSISALSPQRSRCLTSIFSRSVLSRRRVIPSPPERHSSSALMTPALMSTPFSSA